MDADANNEIVPAVPAVPYVAPSYVANEAKPNPDAHAQVPYVADLGPRAPLNYNPNRDLTAPLYIGDTVPAQPVQMVRRDDGVMVDIRTQPGQAASPTAPGQMTPTNTVLVPAHHSALLSAVNALKLALRNIGIPT